MTSNTLIKNIAAYKFVDLPEAELPEVQQALRQKCSVLDLRGTILLSPEGINLFLAGEEAQIDDFCDFLRAKKHFADMQYKASYSKKQPFQRMFVKLKKEIITLADPDIQPAKFSGLRLRPVELKKWLDEKRDFTLLDTRNDFEINIGSFEKANHLNMESFRDFPKAINKILPALKAKPVVMFCTGGIRCEKASAVMLNQGFKEVYQLDGGILKYFEEVGSEHFRGECFVFDERVALDGNLQETGAVLCDQCQSPVTLEQEKGDAYRKGEYCPYCVDEPTSPDAQ